ncbi:MAG TPA: hypothetical protein VFM29_05645, partial [Vicinamibacteria bacterium]|nr:hypothetical protein [Vicinamibacteria bacterium]
MSARVPIGALWGVGAAGLVAAHLRAPSPWVWLVAGALFGGALAWLRPGARSLERRALAVLAALAGTAAPFFPEPTVFLLVPLVAASVAWPFKEHDEPEPLRRALPAWALPALFVAASAFFFYQSASRFWQYGAGS